MTVIDPVGATNGVIGKDLPKKSILSNMNKSELIKLLYLAEDYYKTLRTLYNNVLSTNMELMKQGGAGTVIETVRSERLDCEVPSDYWPDIKEVRVIDEWTEETKVFKESAVNGGWIYCSERMPTSDEYIQNDGRFIVTDGMRVYQRHFDSYKYNMFIEPMVSNTFNDLLDYSVIAWQPLPEKPEQEERHEAN